MKSILADIRSAVAATIVLAIVCCGLYPLIVYGIAQTLFREKANGSLILDREGKTRGSRLLGQSFSGESYFHPRPSSAGQGYDAANSSGSNLGPTSQKLHDAIRERVAAYRRENGLTETNAVPADAVTASGSGLDPHISTRNAELQLPRVARARNLPEREVRLLLDQHTEGPTLGILGDPRVNVLMLNLALDSILQQDRPMHLR